jgi:hypothetical protein
MDHTSVIEPEHDAVASLPAGSVTDRAHGLLLQMFADPHLLEPEQRRDLASSLRHAVAEDPEVAELRVLLGMVLCVNLEIQPAIEELRTAVRLAPRSFIAHLKMGELWMRLRVVDKADEHTHQAALLARNLAQSELARRQAAAIRTMRREGIERGGYKSPLALVGRLRRLFARHRSATTTPDALEVGRATLV